MLEFPFDTTRAVANLVSSGTLARHPNVRLILSHAGGTVPFVANRLLARTEDIGDLIRRSQTAASPDELEQLSNAIRDETFAELRGLYYDTALSANPTVLGPLRDLAPTTHILAGTDLPFVPETSAQLYLRDVERFSGLTSAELAANARNLFPRWRGSS
jgi:predicted TIM-barrel fold metal-dependent hydrolase